MSANNYVLVTKDADKFIVENCDADTGENNYTIAICDTLDEAVKQAQENSENVEYGISFRL